MTRLQLATLGARRSARRYRPSLVHEFIPLTILRFSSIFFFAPRAAAPLRINDSRCAASVSSTDAPTSCVSARTSAHLDKTSDDASSRSAPRIASTRLARSPAAAVGAERASDEARRSKSSSRATSSLALALGAAFAFVSVAVDPTRAKLSAAPANHVPRAAPSPSASPSSPRVAPTRVVVTPLIFSRSRCSRVNRLAPRVPLASSATPASPAPRTNPRSARPIVSHTVVVVVVVVVAPAERALGTALVVRSPRASRRASSSSARARAVASPCRVSSAALARAPSANALDRASQIAARSARRSSSIARSVATTSSSGTSSASFESPARTRASRSIARRTSALATRTSSRSTSSSRASSVIRARRDGDGTPRTAMPTTMMPRASARVAASRDADGASRKTCVVTGANAGIGLATVRALRASCEYSKITLACRDASKARRAIDALARDGAASTCALVFRELDLASVASARDFAASYLDDEGDDGLDCLVNNAGVMAVPKLERTRDGFELQVGVNHLGHHALTAGLMPALAKSEDARVICVSSEAHRIAGKGLAREDLFGEKNYSAWGQYGQSKLANVLFAFELARRCERAGLGNVTASALHPGAVDSELGRYLQPPDEEIKWWQTKLYDFIRLNFLKTTEQGAATSVFLAREIARGEARGKYYSDCAEKTPAKNCLDVDDARWLWDRSAELTGVGFDSLL